MTTDRYIVAAMHMINAEDRSPANPHERTVVLYADHVAALRACEARVREDERGKWSDLAHDNWQNGWEEGLDAARDAVAALLGKTVPPSDGVTEALAAIDAQRQPKEES